jgi:hypothetical protein
VISLVPLLAENLQAITESARCDRRSPTPSLTISRGNDRNVSGVGVFACQIMSRSVDLVSPPRPARPDNRTPLHPDQTGKLRVALRVAVQCEFRLAHRAGGVVAGSSRRTGGRAGAGSGIGSVRAGAGRGSGSTRIFLFGCPMLATRQDSLRWVVLDEQLHPGISD